MKSFFIIVLFLFTVLSITSCTSKVKNVAEVQATVTPTPKPTPTLTPTPEPDPITVQLEGMGSLSGALMMSTHQAGKVTAAKDADIKFEGHPEYDSKASETGVVNIPNIVPGVYTIYAEATLPAALSARKNKNKKSLRTTSDEPRMAQFKEIIISSTSSTELPETTLSEPGSLSGTVSLINNPNNVTLDGIMVFIPGTSYIAMTDSMGAFSMTNIPAGNYDVIRFSKDGLTTADLNDIDVTSATNTTLGNVYMSLSTGPSGAILGVSDTNTVDGISYPVLSQGDGNTVVTVSLRYDTRAVLMKVAHESSFLNVEWIPVSTVYTFTNINNEDAVDHFSSDGTKYVYVKFADLNGLESSVYYTRFIIDNDNPIATSATLLFGWGNVGSTDQGDGTFAYQKVPIELSASDQGTGLKEMIICNNSSFTGCTWEDFSSTISEWDLGDGTAGEKTVYIKVRDYLGKTSNLITDSIVVGTYTTITSSTQDEVTLNKEWGPYSYDSSLTFTGDLVINPGVQIYYKDNFTITVQGILTLSGTSNSYVELKEYQDGQSFAGFILNTGLGGPHLINYLKIENENYNDGYIFKINGGEIKNSILYVRKMLLDKTGSQTLSINHNTITGPGVGLTLVVPLILLEDGSNTTLEYNNFTMDLSDNAGSPVIIVGKTLYTAANIQYNTFYFTDDPTGGRFSNNVLLRTETGTTSFQYNHVYFGLDNANSSTPKIFHTLNSSIVNVYHNNLQMLPHTGATVNLRYFHKENNSIVNAGNTSSYWNYTGTFAQSECGDSADATITSCPNDSSLKYCGYSATTISGCQSSAFSTVANDSGCVGHSCTGSEN